MEKKNINVKRAAYSIASWILFGGAVGLAFSDSFAWHPYMGLSMIAACVILSITLDYLKDRIK